MSHGVRRLSVVERVSAQITSWVHIEPGKGKVTLFIIDVTAMNEKGRRVAYQMRKRFTEFKLMHAQLADEARDGKIEGLPPCDANRVFKFHESNLVARKDNLNYLLDFISENAFAAKHPSFLEFIDPTRPSRLVDQSVMSGARPGAGRAGGGAGLGVSREDTEYEASVMIVRFFRDFVLGGAAGGAPAGAASFGAAVSQVRAGLSKMGGLLRSGFEVSKFPTSGAPRIRMLWMHPEGKLVLGKAVDGADAAKAIMLEHVSIVRVGVDAPNFSSSSKAQREAAGNEASCLSIHGSAAEPSFHIRLATPGSADVLASKLLDMQREFVRADYNATMRRAQAISYARAGRFLSHELLQTLRGQTKGHADMEDTVKVTALNPASDADMEAVAALLKKAAKLEAKKAAAASAPAETQKERNMRITRATPPLPAAAGESV